MEAAAANAKWGRLHEERPYHDGTFTRWVEKPSNSHPYFKDWGVTTGVTDVDLRPNDRFLTVEKCGPVDHSRSSDVVESTTAIEPSGDSDTMQK